MQSAPKIFSDFNQMWIFLIDYNKSLQYQISRQTFQWQPSWCMRTEGQTGMTDLMDASRDLRRTHLKISG